MRVFEPIMTARHIYVDETKERGYVLVATVHLTTDIDTLRKTIKRFVLPGQNRIHMAKEGNARRREIVDTICNAGVTATVYDAGRRYGSDELAARAAGLRAIVSDTTPGEQTLLVMEQDDSLIHWDKKLLYKAVRTAGRAEALQYEHRRAKSEPALTIPDAIAWCWARGGLWRQRIQPAVTAVVQI
jgi:hypothetical protein